MDLPVLAPRRGLRSLFRRGPHDAEILRLAVPAFGALVAEPLFLLADAAIVGRIGTTALGGLGVASQALTTLVSISIFLAYGTTAAAVIYLRISLLGAPAMLGVLAGTGVLRGLQDTRTPLAVAVGANLMNIVLNAVLVLG